jgi:hypothetical protein
MNLRKLEIQGTRLDLEATIEFVKAIVFQNNERGGGCSPSLKLVLSIHMNLYSAMKLINAFGRLNQDKVFLELPSVDINPPYCN